MICQMTTPAVISSNTQQVSSDSIMAAIEYTPKYAGRAYAINALGRFLRVGIWALASLLQFHIE